MPGGLSGGLSRRVGVAIFAIAVVVMGIGVSSGLSATFHLRVASSNSAGHRANGETSTEGVQLISGDGKKVAFVSTSSNLPGGDGVHAQAYVKNMQTGETRIVSRVAGSDPADNLVSSVGISADGRFVLVWGVLPGFRGANAHSQVWERNLKTGKIRLASSFGGDPGLGSSSNGWVSGDGRFVAFESSASNFPGGDGTHDFFYRANMKKGKLALVSRTAQGEPATATEYGQALSSDGQLAAFVSDDPDLPGGGGGVQHAYVRDLGNGTTREVDVFNGQPGDDRALDASLSGNGRFVAFTSDASNLPAGDGSAFRAYRLDLKTDKLILAGRTSAGAPVDDRVTETRLSFDGSRMSFDSTGANLPGGNGTTYQVYLRRFGSGKTQLLSTNGHAAGDSDSYYDSISTDGRWVTFDSSAENLGTTPGHTSLLRAGPIN